MKYLYVFLACILSIEGFAQNIIPNPSFEDTLRCPELSSPSTAFETYCKDWRQYTLGTPDLMHRCSYSNVGVPSNMFGIQEPFHGDAYAGIYVMLPDWDYEYKEYIAAQIPTLQKGIRYSFSMYVSRSEYNGIATNDLGALFTTRHKGDSSRNVLAVVPQISFTTQGPIQNSNSWTKLSGTFVADSAYDQIVIGGFLRNSEMDTVSVFDSWVPALNRNPFGYYYVDSVDLHAMDVLLTNCLDTFLCAGAPLSVPYTVSDASYFQPGNTFTLQLSDSDGNFTNPVKLGIIAATSSGTFSAAIPPNIPHGTGYRMRIVASTPQHSSPISPWDLTVINISLKAGSNSPICSGTTLLLKATASDPAEKWWWQGPGFSSDQQNPGILFFSGSDGDKYVVVAEKYGCSFTAETSVKIVSPPAIRLKGTTHICPGAMLQLEAKCDSPAATFLWSGPHGYISHQQLISFRFGKGFEGYYKAAAYFNGCISTDSILVNLSTTDPPVVRDTTLCLHAPQITLPVTGDSLKWYTSANSQAGSWQQPSYSTSDKGVREMFVTQTINGCESDKATISIYVAGKPEIDLGPDRTVCDDQTIELGNWQPDVTYKWNTGDTGCCVKVPHGKYTQVISGRCGAVMDSVVIREITCDSCLIIPTAFTPNGDGRNDLFGAVSRCALKSFQIKIFDRWGNLVFESSSHGQRWNGLYRNEPAEVGTYFYVIAYLPEFTDKERKIPIVKGEMHLLR